MSSVSNKPSTSEQAFPITRWSLVAGARPDGGGDAGSALQSLCQLYWPPLYAYLRRVGHSREDAEDYTQGFLVSLIQDEALVRADPDRGKLRSFLLGSLKRHVARMKRDGSRLKRGGGAQCVSIDAADADQRYEAILVDDLTPEHLYDRMWVSTLVQNVLNRLGEEMTASGRGELFGHLRAFLLETTAETGAYARIAADLKMSEGAVKVAVHRLRGRYRDLLVQHITDTLASEDSLADEVQYLLGLAGK